MNKIRFKMGTPVTENSPTLDPGSFVFDTKSLALYIDKDDKRIQVKDPTKISLTGGTITGDLNIEKNGVTTCSFSSTGLMTGSFLILTGDLHTNKIPTDYAVIENGSIKSRTALETKQDLKILKAETSGEILLFEYNI